MITARCTPEEQFDIITAIKQQFYEGVIFKKDDMNVLGTLSYLVHNPRYRVAFRRQVKRKKFSAKA